MSGRRSERVAEEIREEVAGIIARGVKDPRIGFVTVTRVGLTPDLRIAHVNVGVLGDQGQRSKTLAGLKQAAGFIRRELGQAHPHAPHPGARLPLRRGARRHGSGGAAPGREPAPPRRRPRAKTTLKRAPDPDLHGVLVVDKPEGPTSHDIVDRVRRALGVRRVGPHRHPRPLRHGRPSRVRGQGHAPRPLPGRGREGVRGHRPARLRHHHRRPDRRAPGARRGR